MRELVRDVSGHELHTVTSLPAHAAIVFRGAVADWPAMKTWTFSRFEDVGADLRVNIKTFSQGKQTVIPMTLKEYVKHVRASEEGQNASRYYLHDVPIFTALPELRRDIGPFPTNALPKWYGAEWWRFVQFFFGPDGATTPLHFDTLLTNNIFFHLRGLKTFTLIPRSEIEKCDRRDWRWFNLDVGGPDFDRIAKERNIRFARVTLNPGDVLHMPPGMLHHVRSSGTNISFNIDYHTRASAMKALLRSAGRAPTQNVKYNLASLGGLVGLNGRKMFNTYSSYLNYVS
jgi:hypothetical protein